jgi:DNA-binding MarR family transcriptional regulator
MSSATTNHTWTFLTNHSQVLICLAQDPGTRIRDIATTIGITERATQRILSILVETGYIERHRTGRRNRYHINRDQTMRHAAQTGQQIGGLLDLLQHT